MGDVKRDAERYLTAALGEGSPVTFRQVARKVGVSVSTAKEILSEYLSSHTASPTYLISGPLLQESKLSRTDLSVGDATNTQSLAHMSATQKIKIVDMDVMSEAGSDAGEEDVKAEVQLENEPEDVVMEEKGEEVSRWGVVLIGADALEEKKKLFAPDLLSVHIYSLSPAPLKDPQQLLIPAQTLRDSPDYLNPALYGGITGEPLLAKSKPLRDGAMSFSSSKKEAKSEPVQATMKEHVKKDSVKKEAAKEQSKEPEGTEVGRKPASSKSRRRVIESDDEDDEPASKPASKPSSTALKGSAKNALEPTSSMARAEDQAAMEAMMAMDVEFDDEEVQETKATADTKPKPAGDRKRKRRQVKKSKTEMDAKGYMVTTDYWTEESCSGSDTDVESDKPKAAPKTAAPPPKQPSKPLSRAGSDPKPKPAVKKGQSTLNSFFKKK